MTKGIDRDQHRIGKRLRMRYWSFCMQKYRDHRDGVKGGDPMGHCDDAHMDEKDGAKKNV